MASIHELFRYMAARECSDLHLSAGMEPRVRHKGNLEVVEGWATQSDDDVRALLRQITSDKQWQEYCAWNDLDFVYHVPGLARFRANYLQQHRGASAVFRIIPEEIIPIDELGLPDVVDSLSGLNSGLVLITGPTGAGKSTTMAAIVDAINQRYTKHIVTIEDPVEFIHHRKKSTLSQRQVGRDTDRFAGALRAAMRQDADVIMIGEMRDSETIELAVAAAEIGALVFGTLHTASAAKSIDRIVDSFPTEQHAQIRYSLSESLMAVVSQILLPTADGRGRCAINEILLKNTGLRKAICAGDTNLIDSIIQSGRGIGMQSMDDALLAAAKAGQIHPRDAFRKAKNKACFESLLT